MNDYAQKVAELVCYLTSNRSGFINGESVEIDGGAFFA
jgi:enoyl-[acyl-carrier-protein] reductase (NADH)